MFCHARLSCNSSCDHWGRAAVTSVHLHRMVNSLSTTFCIFISFSWFSVIKGEKKGLYFFLLSSNSNVQNVFLFFSAKNDTFPDTAETTSQRSVISVISEWYLWKGMTEDMRWNPRVWRQPWDWVLSASRGTKSRSFEEDRRERCSKASQRCKKFYFLWRKNTNRKLLR